MKTVLSKDSLAESSYKPKRPPKFTKDVRSLRDVDCGMSTISGYHNLSN